MHPLYARGYTSIGCAPCTRAICPARISAPGVGGGSRTPTKSAESISRRTGRPGVHKGFTLWFTGMSGAGKSTISNLLEQRLRELGAKVEVLDGDVVRTHLSKGLGFSKEDRDINIRRIGFVCELLSRNGVIAIAAAISPYRAVREEVRARIANFVEVYVECPVEVLAERDVKGLYKKALAGEIAAVYRHHGPLRAAAGSRKSRSIRQRKHRKKASRESGLHWKTWVWLALIDLHSHTNESDGTCSPAQLIAEAVRSGVKTLGITDHDTFSGYDQAVAHAPRRGVDLVCGIELSTKLHGHSVHLLGYFPARTASPAFREWVLEMQASRRDRNVRLVARLQELGFDITLEEAEARGRGLTGRPHFAQIMVEKGYVANMRQAFDEYLDESAKGYVYRREPTFAEGVRRIREAGGIASLAHPVRVREAVPPLMPELCDCGMNAIEAYHSDHTPADTELYLELARKYGLLVTGGSDFHGDAKPGVRLGAVRTAI